MEGPTVRAYRIFLSLFVIPAMLCGVARAQNKAEPGKYDYYLLTLSWSPEFCSIQGTGQECKAHPGFIVHGLWPQNFDGTYPQFCDEGRPGPAHPEQNMDITPDSSLLAHEWAKHGTCTRLAPDAFFGMERQAFQSVKIPAFFSQLDHEVSVKTDAIVTMFDEANPGLPAGSLVVSCVKERLSAVQVCLAKDGLKPIACGKIETCDSPSIQVIPPVAK
jgi:ribonuclease T2